MKKKEIVRSNIIFNEIINTGTKISSQYFTIYYKEKDNSLKFGIAVGKKIGNAVVRNKYKRRIKTILDKIKNLAKIYNYIIVLRKNCLNISFQELEKELCAIMKKVK